MWARLLHRHYNRVQQLVLQKASCAAQLMQHFIDVDGVISGFKMIKEKKKPIYISVGHKINLVIAIRIVKQLVKPEERIPEPLRLADIYSKAQANSVP